MTKRMLIDATHGEETRVVVLDGNRLEDFDVETSTKRQLKGNIYLAKVVRVEPSLQAAFVEYGGGRHGFLAFGEIHPDYYQIPVADRERLIQMQAEEARAAAQAEEDEVVAEQRQPRADSPVANSGAVTDEIGDAIDAALADDASEAAHGGTPDSLLSHSSSVEGSSVVEAASSGAVVSDAVEISNDVESPATLVAESGSESDSTSGHDADVGSEPGNSIDAPAPMDGGDLFAPSGDEVAPPSEPAFEEPSGDAGLARPDTETASVVTSTDDLDLTDRSDQSTGPDEADRPSSGSQPALMAQDVRFGRVEDVSGRSSQAPFEPRAALDDESGDPDMPQPDLPPPETIGGESDASEDARARRTYRFLRNYRIQEVIRRRQIMLVQVVKEERGTKGAALTTYISLAGRFCVLMPNSPRGGGISRKITSPADRRRLKEVMTELDLPDGMGLIVRTDAANRPKPEIKRDCEYLMRLWDDIREHTLRSIAPALIYEEASLIKRSIRDVYSRDVDEILVDGEEGWRAAHEFMRMLMPSHAKKVILWKESGQPLFSKHQVEAQLDAMLSPTVQLRSGGYLVINQTEALVAIDVNSGRSTRERGIEETALRTNLEAADEVARQLRLRDLAGLIVIDFIDMEPKKHNAMVERRLKEALKIDRARIQIGHISHFGLMEMSRQRLRPSLAETSFVTCPHCGGLGHVRGIESSAIHVLRAIEEEAGKVRASLVLVHVANAVVMYILNHKRERLGEIETRYAMRVHFAADETLVPPQVRIERLKPALAELDRQPDRPALAPPVLLAAQPPFTAPEPSEDIEEEPEVQRSEANATPGSQSVAAPGTAEAEAANAAEENERRRRRRRRRRGPRRDGATGELVATSSDSEGTDEDAADTDDTDVAPAVAVDATSAPTEPAAAASNIAESGMEADREASGSPAVATDATAEPATAIAEAGADPTLMDQPNLNPEELDENGLPKARRRGRRGGRQRSRREGPDKDVAAPAGAARNVAPDTFPTENFAPPVYAGPTPADPFGGHTFDIFDLMDRVSEDPAPATRPAPPGRAAGSRSPTRATPPDTQSVEAPATEPVSPVLIEPAAAPETDGPPHVELPIAAEAPAAKMEPVGSDHAGAPAQGEIPLPELGTEPAASPVGHTANVDEAQPSLPEAETEPTPQPSSEAVATGPEIQPNEAPPLTEPEQPPIPPPASAIQPKLVGGDLIPDAERKRGWWRR